MQLHGSKWSMNRRTRRSNPWIVIILVSLCGCVALLDILGFRLAIFLFLLFLPQLLGANNWWGSLIFAVCGSVGVFYVFNSWLNVLLPVGAFGI